MFTRKHRLQLLAFVLIGVVSVVYAGAGYGGLDRLFGTRGYLVTAQLADSGGIFVNAEVTYRGVAVGEVTATHLTGEGVSVDLDIDSDAPKVPADTNAVVGNRSAVGEQYVDLQPKHEHGPFLEAGSVIHTDRTSIPLSPDTVLSNLDKLVAGVHTDSLRTVVDETYNAFTGAGGTCGSCWTPRARSPRPRRRTCRRPPRCSRTEVWCWTPSGGRQATSPRSPPG